MVRVVIYGEKPTDIEGLEKMLREILTENRRWPQRLKIAASSAIWQCLALLS